MIGWIKKLLDTRDFGVILIPMKDGMTTHEGQAERARLATVKNQIREDLDDAIGNWGRSNGERDNLILSLESQLKWAEEDYEAHFDTEWVGN